MTDEAQKPDDTKKTDNSSKPDFDVRFEKDAVAESDKTSGLAAVYAGRAAFTAADDIADLLIYATNGQPMEVLVANDGSLLADNELARVIRFQMGSLRARMEDAGISFRQAEELAPARAQGRRGKDKMPEVAYENIAAFGAPIIALLSMIPAGIGFVSKLLAHQYVTSGVALEHPRLGLDLRVAGSIRAKVGASTTAHVHVQRFWSVPELSLLKELTSFVGGLYSLLGAVTTSSAVAETKKAQLDDAIAGKAAARLALPDLSKTAADSKAWETVWAYVTSAADKDLASLAAASAEATSAASALTALRDDVEAFIVALLAADDGESTHLMRAMRAEWLGEDATRVLLYVRCFNAGLDQVIETKLGPDRRAVMAGASVEYAAVRSGGALLFSGVADNLWGGSMKLDNVVDFSGSPIDYAVVRNAARVEPASG